MLLPDLTPGLTQARFRDSLRVDRRLEFVFEYSRWFDLIRYKPLEGPDSYLIKSLHAAGKTNAQPKHYLYPIPSRRLIIIRSCKGSRIRGGRGGGGARRPTADHDF